MDSRKIDEIKYKAKSQNTTVVVEAVSILTKTISKLISIGDDKPNKQSGVTDEYLRLLQELCSSENSGVSSTACCGVLTLVNNGFLEPKDALKLIMATTLSAKNYSGIASAVLTLSELENCQWKLVPPIHPFVIILQRHPEAIRDVYNEMSSKCSQNKRTGDNYLRLFKPVFMWTLCNPKDPTPSFYKAEILKLLLGLNDDGHEPFLLKCLAVQQISVKYVDTLEIYSIVVNWAIPLSIIKFSSSILPAIVTIGENLIRNGENPKQCFLLIEKVVHHTQDLYSDAKIEKDHFHSILNCTIGLLSHLIIICPVTYMSELISLCDKICTNMTSEISAGMVICALLQWEYKKSVSTESFNDEMRNLINKLKNINNRQTAKSFLTCNVFNALKSMNRQIYMMDKFINLYQSITNNSVDFNKWISNLMSCKSTDVKCDNLLFLQAILVVKFNFNKTFDISEVIETSLNILQIKKSSMITHLPVILHCVRLSQKPIETHILLSAIPEMASVKENIPIVVDILKILENNKSISMPFIISLYIKLIDKQSRCFPYLQMLLAKTGNIEKKSELLTAKANALKYICETRAVNHGLDVVPILSEILAQCTTEDSSAACSLSLEAITALWKAEVIDPISTWQVLAPKFHLEKRHHVITSICNVLAVVPDLYYESSEYDDFINKTATKLWKCIIESDDENLSLVAFKALSKYDLKHLTMRQIPDVYKQGIELPSSFNKLASEVTQTIDDMTYIPSALWGNLFKFSKNSSLSGVVIFCNVLMDKEVSGYHSGIYNAATKPENVKYLPLASIVKGVIEYVRRNINNLDTNMKECIRCISLPLSKPLPPINWSFFSNVLKQSNSSLSGVKICIIKLLSKQVDISPSALKVIVEYLESIKSDVDEIKIFANIVYDVFKFVKVPLLLSLLSDSLDISYSIAIAKNCGDENLFKTLLNEIKKCLSDTIIDAVVKKDLSNLLSNYYDTIELQDKIWIPYADACTMMDEDCLTELLLRRNKKSDCIRMKLCLENDPESCLFFLHESITIAIENKKDLEEILFQVHETIKRLDDELSIQSWILKLLSNLQNELTENNGKNEAIAVLFEVFMQAVITLSEIEVFSNSRPMGTYERLGLLPLAIDSLFSEGRGAVSKNLGSQIIEWCHCHTKSKRLSRCFVESLEITLLAHCAGSSLKNLDLWPKYCLI